MPPPSSSQRQAALDLWATHVMTLVRPKLVEEAAG
jgi:hypothetical protein